MKPMTIPPARCDISIAGGESQDAYSRAVVSTVELEVTLAYDRLRAHKDYVPDRVAFRTVALRKGMSEDRFEMWSEGRSWR